VSGSEQAGGLVAQNVGVISSCYSTGSVSAQFAGGLVGVNGGVISFCYATGAVSGTYAPYAGGLVGHSQTLSLLTACFWDVQTSGQTSSIGGIGFPQQQCRVQRVICEYFGILRVK